MLARICITIPTLYNIRLTHVGVDGDTVHSSTYTKMASWQQIFWWIDSSMAIYLPLIILGANQKKFAKYPQHAQKMCVYFFWSPAWVYIIGTYLTCVTCFQESRTFQLIEKLRWAGFFKWQRIFYWSKNRNL